MMSIMRVADLGEINNRWALTEEHKNFGTLRSQRGALPLSDLHLDVAIRGLDFTLKLRQTFLNVHSESIEAVYIFPLPAGAAVSAFTMTTENRVVHGALLERGQARANYQTAIEAGQQAALVEQERPEIFTMTVGNLPALQSIQVELTLDGPLNCIDDTALFRFPLVVAPRYIPGQPLKGKDVGVGAAADTDRVPDASRITPPTLLTGYPNPVRLSIEVELDSPLLDWQRLKSSIPLQLQGTRLVYAPETGRIDHDFILALPFQPDKMATSLQIQGSTFCLTVVPPASLSQKIRPKRVAILLDRSASMQGWKMSAARRTVARLVDSLNSGDSFCILAFDDRLEEVEPDPHPQGQSPRSQDWFKLGQSSSALVEASDRNRCDYLLALQKIEARGGTDIAPALKAAVTRLGPAEVDRQVVLVTDGQVGNEAEILAWRVREATGIRISTVGIDSAVNADFLERLASESAGLCQLVHNDEQLDESMTRICRRIGNPTLLNLRIEGAQLSERVFQHNDLYPGLPTRIYGRLAGPPPDHLTLAASYADGTPYTAQVEPLMCQGTVEKLWARQRVLQMEYAFEVGAPNAPQPDRITKFSLLHGVLCRFTAFLAVDQQNLVLQHTHTQVQPVQSPSGWQELPRKVQSGGGLIRVDLLPTERRGFSTPKWVQLLLLPFTLPLMFFHYLKELWMSRKKRPRKTQLLLQQLLQLLQPPGSTPAPSVLKLLDQLLDSLGTAYPQSRAQGQQLRQQLSTQTDYSALQRWAEALQQQLLLQS